MSANSVGLRRLLNKNARPTLLIILCLGCTGPTDGPRRHLRAEAVAKEPYLVWNTFVDLLAMEEYETLSLVQRPAHLAFHYDAEVQNGGHHQYFENSAGRRSRETVEALLQLGLKCQAETLRQAIAIWDSKERRPAETAEDFMDLKDHQKDFVIVEGAA